MESEILANNGFIVYANENGKFIFEKKPTKTNKSIIDPIEFDNFNEAKDYINSILSRPIEWQATVRFNRGLGIEYKIIKPIIANLKEEAKEIAHKQAEKNFGDSIIEIKVIPIINIP